jgi:hypothetical protein
MDIPFLFQLIMYAASIDFFFTLLSVVLADN